MDDDDFEQMFKSIDHDNNQSIDFLEFKNYFDPPRGRAKNDPKRSGPNGGDIVPPSGVIEHMPLETAVALIQEKVRARIKGGPAVSTNHEFCIKNEELCINNKELCILNDEFCRNFGAHSNSSMSMVQGPLSDRS